MNDDQSDSVCFRISGQHDVAAAALRLARHPALRGASSVDRSLVATIVSELGSNIVKYARRGTITIDRKEQEGCVDIEVSAHDDGPGISDVALALSDHFSTSGTLGLGLPGVRRMADGFVIDTAAGQGTEVRVRKRILSRPSGTAGSGSVAPTPKTVAPRASLSMPPVAFGSGAWDLGARLRTCEGHAVSGDRALSLRCDDGLLLAIVDASGHGPSAHALAARVEEVFVHEGSADIVALMHRFDDTLRGTSGAAAGLVFIKETTGEFCYLGVGNTRAAKVGLTSWHGLSREGVLGGRSVRYTPFSGTLSEGDLLLLWTDGLPEVGCSALAEANSFRGAQEIANLLIAQLARPYDDAGCLVLRWRP